MENILAEDSLPLKIPTNLVMMRRRIRIEKVTKDMELVESPKVPELKEILVPIFTEPTPCTEP
ncbi:hypothetical protein K7432_016121 [Basidiobolus ranarum]|uniref:Uncharacterized protein n=2 Tax=Basidiobolus ranarum TaxID=34480 RepID=A0ABR2WF69_9FUNG